MVCRQKLQTSQNTNSTGRKEWQLAMGTLVITRRGQPHERGLKAKNRAARKEEKKKFTRSEQKGLGHCSIGAEMDELGKKKNTIVRLGPRAETKREAGSG